MLLQLMVTYISDLEDGSGSQFLDFITICHSILKIDQWKMLFFLKRFCAALYANFFYGFYLSSGQVFKPQSKDCPNFISSYERKNKV